MRVLNQNKQTKYVFYIQNNLTNLPIPSLLSFLYYPSYTSPLGQVLNN